MDNSIQSGGVALVGNGGVELGEELSELPLRSWLSLLFEFPGLELPFTDWVPLIALFNVSVEVRFLCDFRPTRPIFWGNGGGRPIASWLVSSPPSRPLSSEDLASII